MSCAISDKIDIGREDPGAGWHPCCKKGCQAEWQGTLIVAVRTKTLVKQPREEYYKLFASQGVYIITLQIHTVIHCDAFIYSFLCKSKEGESPALSLLLASFCTTMCQ